MRNAFCLVLGALCVTCPSPSLADEREAPIAEVNGVPILRSEIEGPDPKEGLKQKIAELAVMDAVEHVTGQVGSEEIQKWRDDAIQRHAAAQEEFEKKHPGYIRRLIRRREALEELVKTPDRLKEIHETTLKDDMAYSSWESLAESILKRPNPAKEVEESYGDRIRQIRKMPGSRVRQVILRDRSKAHSMDMAVGKERLRLMRKWAHLLLPERPPKVAKAYTEDPEQEQIMLMMSHFAYLMNDLMGVWLNGIMSKTKVRILTPEFQADKDAILARLPEPDYLKSKIPLEIALNKQNHADPGPAAWAAISILEAGPGAVKPLLSCAKTRSDCLHYLFVIDSERAKKLIRDEMLFRSVDCSEKSFAIMTNDGFDAVFRKLAGILEDSAAPTELRTWAIEYCHRIFSPECTPVLKKLRSDKNKEISEAIERLPDIGGWRPISPLPATETGSE